ncbi:MAG: hypothetical protein DRH24_20360 [Deltaproteobacteria bacterium]|nr:MAG: hypothetical protein DRH24_20360 [Deltaproteobacteria bacterium]
MPAVTIGGGRQCYTLVLTTHRAIYIALSFYNQGIPEPNTFFKYISSIPYLKIEKTAPQIITPDQLNRFICNFSERADSSMEMRNLIIIMLHIAKQQGFAETLTI